MTGVSRCRCSGNPGNRPSLATIGAGSLSDLSRWRQSPSPEFQKIMGHGHQGELPRHIAQPPQKDLPQALGLLDQPMDRFGNGFAPRVDRPPFFRLQLGPLGSPQRCPGLVSRSDPAPMVPLSPSGHVGISLPLRQHPEVAFAPVPCIHREPIRLALFFGNPERLEVVLQTLQHGPQPGTVGAVRLFPEVGHPGAVAVQEHLWMVGLWLPSPPPEISLQPHGC